MTLHFWYMTARAQTVLQEALSLPDDDRADIVAELFASLDETVDDPETVQMLWAEELEKRAKRDPQVRISHGAVEVVLTRSAVGVARAKELYRGASEREVRDAARRADGLHVEALFEILESVPQTFPTSKQDRHDRRRGGDR